MASSMSKIPRGKFLGEYRLKKRFELTGDLGYVFNLHMYLPANGRYCIYESVDTPNKWLAMNSKKCISFEFLADEFDEIFDRFSRRDVDEYKRY